MGLPKLFQMAGLCKNRYSNKVNELLKSRDKLIKIPGFTGGDLYSINKRLTIFAKLERKQWLKDTFEDRKKEAKEKEQKKLNNIFDEYFN